MNIYFYCIEIYALNFVLGAMFWMFLAILLFTKGKCEPVEFLISGMRLFKTEDNIMALVCLGIIAIPFYLVCCCIRHQLDLKNKMLEELDK